MEKKKYDLKKLAEYKKLLANKYYYIKDSGLCYISVDSTIVYIGYSNRRMDMMADWLYQIDHNTEENKYKILRELKHIKVGPLDFTGAPIRQRAYATYCFNPIFNIERINPWTLEKSYNLLGKYVTSSYIREHLNKWRTWQTKVGWPLWKLIPEIGNWEQEREIDERDVRRLKSEQWGEVSMDLLSDRLDSMEQGVEMRTE